MNESKTSCASTDQKWSTWESIDWNKCEIAVNKLQARIVKAQKEGKHGRVKALQWMLTHSFYAKALAVKRVTSNRGSKTAGVDKAVWATSNSKFKAISELRRRGYTPSSLRDFCERIGVAKANSEVEAGQLESCIRDELNVTAERVMVVMQPLELIITNRGDDYSELVDFEINPNQPEKGMRKISFSNTLYIEQDDFAVVPPPKNKRMTVGAYIRLKGAYIVKCTGYEEEDGQVRRVFAEIVEGTHSGEDNSGIKAKGVIHWVDKKN